MYDLLRTKNPKDGRAKLCHLLGFELSYLSLTLL
jgi:hypothetical protein